MCKPDADYEKVITYCNLVLESQSTNPKAHFRKGVALYNLKDYDEALASFLKAKDHAGAAGEFTWVCISQAHLSSILFHL